MARGHSQEWHSRLSDLASWSCHYDPSATYGLSGEHLPGVHVHRIRGGSPSWPLYHLAQHQFTVHQPPLGP
jgi:hypothetical protein